MNRFKIVCVFLSIALIYSLIQINLLRKEVVCNHFSKTNDCIPEDIFKTQQTTAFYPDLWKNDSIKKLVLFAQKYLDEKDIKNLSFIIIQDKSILKALKNQISSEKTPDIFPQAIILCTDTANNNPEKQAQQQITNVNIETRQIEILAHLWKKGTYVFTFQQASPEADNIACLLNLPETICPEKLIVIGRAKNNPTLHQKNRNKLREVHFDHW